MNRFEGQAVFITGGNKGIGQGIARRFASEGARVAIAAIEKDTPYAAAALAEETGVATIGLSLGDVVLPSPLEAAPHGP